ncbi:glycosyltransferase family 4 protein [Planktothrix pseudagardhii]|uniref:Archaeal glycosylation protein 16 n=1 Tax=Planktothrix pseudagardhii TaxID=132604 RepID=A0A9W4G3G4_9CYAN|nr:glycosyltransferase family 4 protein [Planktothrix pseudagardhii]CAD5920019.1 Archaeal glycosylation protein 16 [Planktothrix pseudagardhii]
MNQRLEVLLVSTPVGPLGSGLGGGVELTVLNLAIVLRQRGHKVTIAAPETSQLESFSIVEIPGELQTLAQTQNRHDPVILPDNSVLTNLWNYAQQVADQYDIILNFAYDWLPLFLTPFFKGKLIHLVSMGSLTDVMDQAVHQAIQQCPGSIAFHTHSQAETFGLKEGYFCLSNAIDLSQYQFCAEPKNQLAWVGRISPEKGLEDAVAASQKTGIPLMIMGKIQDEAYWQTIVQNYSDAPIQYLGFLSTEKLQEQVRQCRALVMTHRWIEAFGNVAIEALACGVPVISYSRGGPTEIIRDSVTGWLVEPDNINELVQAIQKLDQIDRFVCRQQAETEYSLDALGDRIEHWLFQVISS